jgi:hypothetical protein
MLTKGDPFGRNVCIYSTSINYLVARNTTRLRGFSDNNCNPDLSSPLRFVYNRLFISVRYVECFDSSLIGQSYFLTLNV